LKPDRLALVVGAVDDPTTQTLFEVAQIALANRYRVEAVDLHREGFRPFMSGDERSAYHSSKPILDPMVRRHAELAVEATAIVFVYRSHWNDVPAMLRGWLERVLVPGVSFVFDGEHKVKPNLRSLEAIAGIATYGHALPRPDLGRALLTRAFRLNVPGRVRTRWFGLAAPVTLEEFVVLLKRDLALL
jgi:putative NADPH-quinone reductase